MPEPLTDEQLVEMRKRLEAFPHTHGDILLLLLGEVERLKAANKELNDLFDVQQTRMAQAIKYWQERTGWRGVLPDSGNLVQFLLDEIDDSLKNNAKFNARQASASSAARSSPAP